MLGLGQRRAGRRSGIANGPFGAQFGGNSHPHPGRRFFARCQLPGFARDQIQVRHKLRDGALPRRLKALARRCPARSELGVDLNLIASEARQLAANEETGAQGCGCELPPSRGPRLDSRMPASARPVVSHRHPLAGDGAPGGWRPVAAAMLDSRLLRRSHKPVSQVARQQTPAIPVTAPAAVIAAVTPAPGRSAPRQVARKSASQNPLTAAVSRQAELSAVWKDQLSPMFQGFPLQ